MRPLVAPIITIHPVDPSARAAVSMTSSNVVDVDLAAAERPRHAHAECPGVCEPGDQIERHPALALDLVGPLPDGGSEGLNGRRAARRRRR